MVQNNLQKFLKRFENAFMQNAGIAMQMSVDRARDIAKQEHEYDDRSGTLTANTISKPVTISGKMITGTVANGSEVALYIHEGTGLYGPKKQAYEIKPVDAKALAWETPASGGDLSGGAGELIFAKRVMHPGIKPDPFLQKAIIKVEPFMKQKLKEAFRLAAQQSVGGK